MKQWVFEFVNRGIDPESLLNMDMTFFHGLCEYICNQGKKERKMTQQEKDMISESKNDEWWKVK